MRILFCNKFNFPFGGTEVFAFELMELLRSCGHEVALFSMADARGAPSRYDKYLLPHIDFKKQQGLWTRARLAAHAIYSRQARVRLRQMIADFKPDIAHVRNIYHHLSPSILWELRAQGVPVLYHVNDFKLVCPSYNLVSHGQTCDGCRGGRFWHVLSSGCYQGAPQASLVLAAEAYVHKWIGTYRKCVDLLLTPSAFARQKLIENGWDGSKIDVLHHFQRLPQRESPEPPLDAPVFYFGRLSPEKGLVDLLQAMRRLPQVPLQIAGEGPQRAELGRMVAELGLSNVRFLGQVQSSELPRLIAGARFTVFPSLAYETMGKAILESYAQARAVVATDLGSRRELVVEGKTGLLYSPGSHEQLAAAISYLYEHPRLAGDMGAAGRELVKKQHSPEKYYDSLMSHYTQLAQAKPRTVVSEPKVGKRLRVAFIGGRGLIGKYSGIEAYYEGAGRHLVETGHEVTIYCRTYFTPPVAEHKGMRLVRLPTVRTKHLETLVHTLLSTVHAMLGDYDIVHYHTLGPGLFSFFPRLAGKKTIVTVHGLDWQRKKWGRLASTVLRLGEWAAVRFPSATMVVSRTLQEYYRARHHAKTAYAPSGTELRARRSGHRLLEWGLDPDQYILFLGRFSPEKNCQLLIQAYERIDTTAKLVLAGGSSYSDEYVKELRRHQNERVLVLDYVSGDALEELLTNAMIFVLPSDLEGLSLALLDAMASGLCVLTSDVPENREVVEGAGFTFRRHNEEDLARMLRLLIGNKELRENAGQAARERVQQQYLWRYVAEEIEREYFRVMGWEPVVHSQPTGAQPGDRAA